LGIALEELDFVVSSALDILGDTLLVVQLLSLRHWVVICRMAGDSKCKWTWWEWVLNTTQF